MPSPRVLALDAAIDAEAAGGGVEVLAGDPPASTGDPELDDAIAKEVANPYGNPLPEKDPAVEVSTPATPWAPTTVWVLKCARPAHNGSPEVAWYFTAEGWCGDRHLAIPFRTEERAETCLKAQDPIVVSHLESWIGGVAEPTERTTKRPAKKAPAPAAKP